MKGLVTRNTHVQYESTITSGKKVMAKVKVFLKHVKVGQTSRSRSQGEKIWYHVKGLVTRNTHVQYESPITSGKKVMAKVNVVYKVGQTSRSRSPCQKLWYSITCLNRIPMETKFLSGLDRIRITQTLIFVKNFCIVVALIMKCAYNWMDQHTYSTTFQLLYVNWMLKLIFLLKHFRQRSSFQ